MSKYKTRRNAKLNRFYVSNDGMEEFACEEQPGWSNTRFAPSGWHRRGAVYSYDTARFERHHLLHHFTEVDRETFAATKLGRYLGFDKEFAS